MQALNFLRTNCSLKIHHKLLREFKTKLTLIGSYSIININKIGIIVVIIKYNSSLYN